MKLATQKITTPNWTLPNDIDHSALSSQQWEWLINARSLTQRFRELTHQQIEHFLEFEKPGNAFPDETAVLQLASNSEVWHRQIQWKYHNDVWVCGRVVVPTATLESAGVELQQLGERSLGDFLFSHPALHRQPIEVCQVSANHPYFQHAIQFNQQPLSYLWSRRSLFMLNQQPLLVAETFLPAFYTYLEKHVSS